ncbi:hypothetical protein [Tepidibacillus sp. LV47]|uniref:hypothetical protein n=1 Tax=Tepidibacillus sp. LV47 TaxID=3398228 RepID=UPI003AADA5DB
MFENELEGVKKRAGALYPEVKETLNNLPTIGCAFDFTVDQELIGAVIKIQRFDQLPYAIH